MRTADLREFYYALRYSARTNGKRVKDEWTSMNPKKLERLVEHLSDTQTPERIKIRELLWACANGKPIRVLDAACGPATELTGYKEENLKVEYTGLDKGESMIRIANERHPEANFVIGDVNELKFSDKSFDVVLLRHVLEHLPSYERAVQEAVRVARRRVIADFFIAPTPLPRDLHFWYEEGRFENWYSRKKFEEFLKSLPIRDFTRHDVVGSVGQSASVYDIRT